MPLKSRFVKQREEEREEEGGMASIEKGPLSARTCVHCVYCSDSTRGTSKAEARTGPVPTSLYFYLGHDMAAKVYVSNHLYLPLQSKTACNAEVN